LDFVGWGYDATYRDQFFALKPGFVMFSYNDNPLGTEKVFRYPLDDHSYAVPDQVFTRIVAKTTTQSFIDDNLATERTRLDINLNIQLSTTQLSGQLTAEFTMSGNTITTQKIISNTATLELWQLYLGQIYLQPYMADAMTTLGQQGTFSVATSAYNLFYITYGTHYVDSVTLGGSLTMRVVTSFSNETDVLYLAAAISGKYASATGSNNSFAIAGQIGLVYQTISNQVSLESTATSTIYGGDARFSDFLLRSEDPNSAATLFTSWKSTLMSNPVAVRFRLIEIWQLWIHVYNDYTMAQQVCIGMATWLGFMPGENPQYCDGVGTTLSAYVRQAGLTKGATFAPL